MQAHEFQQSLRISPRPASAVDPRRQEREAGLFRLRAIMSDRLQRAESAILARQREYQVEHGAEMRSEPGWQEVMVAKAVQRLQG